MCDPLTIAGIALTAGSTVANNMANAQVQRARNDALAAERIRQGRLDQEAAALNRQSQNRYEDFGGQQEATRQTLADFIQQQTTPEPAAGTMMPESGSNMVVREENRQRQSARDFTNQTGEALASLRSFGDLLGSIGREQARDAGLIGQVGGFKRGWAGVLPYELEAANERGQGLRMFGDILGGVGGVSLNAGLSGANPFGMFDGVNSAAKTNRLVPTVTPKDQSRLVSHYGGR